jgi:pyruvate/2-oxoglutarate dehydrogenase complex dihydrolipoamide acyltransferase (E2) component
LTPHWNSGNKRTEKERAIVTILKVPKSGGMNTTRVSVVRWLKSEGDTIKQGDPVVELETEKVSYELDSPVDGVLIKIIAHETAEVPVGDPLCHIGQPQTIATNP